MNLKILIFHVYFFNMDISLIIALICLKTCMCFAEICLEERVSQNFVLGHIEKGILKENTKIHKSYPFLS